MRQDEIMEWRELRATKAAFKEIRKEIQSRKEAVSNLLFAAPGDAVDRGIIQRALEVKAMESILDALENGDLSERDEE